MSEKTILLRFFYVWILVFLTEICEASNAIASFPQALMAHLRRGGCPLLSCVLLRQTHALSSPAVEKTDKKDRRDGSVTFVAWAFLLSSMALIWVIWIIPLDSKGNKLLQCSCVPKGKGYY